MICISPSLAASWDFTIINMLSNTNLNRQWSNFQHSQSTEPLKRLINPLFRLPQILMLRLPSLLNWRVDSCSSIWTQIGIQPLDFPKLIWMKLKESVVQEYIKMMFIRSPGTRTLQESFILAWSMMTQEMKRPSWETMKKCNKISTSCPNGEISSRTSKSFAPSLMPLLELTLWEDLMGSVFMVALNRFQPTKVESVPHSIPDPTLLLPWQVPVQELEVDWLANQIPSTISEGHIKNNQLIILYIFPGKINALFFYMYALSIMKTILELFYWMNIVH